MAQFEQEWNEIVESSEILSGAEEEGFLKAACKTEIDSSCIAFLERCVEGYIPIRIVSVNWSTKWIRRSLGDKSLMLKSALEGGTALQIYANELEYSDAISTGRLIKYPASLLMASAIEKCPSVGCRKLECGQDKGLLMQRLLEQNSHGPSVYIGDSLLDIEPLLLADIGIVLGNDRRLTSFLQRLSIPPRLLVTRQLESELNQRPRYCDRDATDGESLLRARDWKQISHFLFAEKKAVPRVLIVAGSDSGGGAGIQADLKTCLATGSFGTTAITAITSQNTFGVQAIHPVPVKHIESQMDSVLSDIGADVVKIGMLPSADVVEAVAKKLKQYDVPAVVVDPVLVSTSGDALASQSVAQLIISELFPLATVVCPNIPEAEELTGLRIESLDHMKSACLLLHKTGPQVVLIKGGHLHGTSEVQDVIYDGECFHVLKHPWVSSDRLHGTGCTLASAIASKLAQGLHFSDAIQDAVQYVEAALKQSASMDIGQGTQLPFDHGYRWHHWPARSSHLDLSLYAITDQKCNQKYQRSFIEAIEAAIAGGATVLQIRDKDTDSCVFLEHVQAALELTKGLGIPVIVNDRVDVAMAANADGIHLGQVPPLPLDLPHFLVQEDLPLESVRHLVGPDKIIGVSAKSVEQALAAEKAGADYLGVGAIFPTSSKLSSVIGVTKLREISEAVEIPIVAIGGITKYNAPDTISAGAEGVAVISTLFDAADPTVAASELLTSVRSALSKKPRKQAV